MENFPFSSLPCSVELRIKFENRSYVRFMMFFSALFWGEEGVGHGDFLSTKKRKKVRGRNGNGR